MSAGESLKTRELSVAEHRALKSLNEGQATEQQQKLAVEVIVKAFCRRWDLAFIPGHPEERDFMLGRQFVADRLMKAFKEPIKGTNNG